uniref:Uncharacterized protein n=1 Tax=Salix viminalis TaxID=40686 RepID=A0A6N2N7W2_SALVM
MVEIDGGEAEKIVAAESSNSRHLPRLSWSLGCGWQIPKGSKLKSEDAKEGAKLNSQVAGGFHGGAVAIQRWKLQVPTEGAHPRMCLINHSWEYFLDPWELFKG